MSLYQNPGQYRFPTFLSMKQAVAITSYLLTGTASDILLWGATDADRIVWE
jgi:hypothetical protein